MLAAVDAVVDAWKCIIINHPTFPVRRISVELNVGYSEGLHDLFRLVWLCLIIYRRYPTVCAPHSRKCVTCAGHADSSFQQSVYKRAVVGWPRVHGTINSSLRSLSHSNMIMQR
ncbi:hypothetical protein J6590_046449 [Homalodisca vitripennis]|nr:hypothetical protein J6590_046449 [Homalodisca vitripennis]